MGGRRSAHVFVTEFDDSGAVLFSTSAGLANANPGVAVHADASGSVAVTASYSGKDAVVRRFTMRF